jgi:tRNA 2-selenouridine synthase
MQLPIDDFLKLRAQLPLVDVRSEGEFQQGHIPGALNIPILNNEERIEVGTIYKQKGKQDAIRAGFRLVGPRLSGIVADAERIGTEFLVHCWRGGARSGNFCQFMSMAQIQTHQLKGGYKTYRAKAIESFQIPLKLNVLSGSTGSGKSSILHALKLAGEQVLDLERLASHKGSVFGGLMMPPQPSTEQFQNDLFEEILSFNLTERIWVEDESLAIGNIFLPEELWQQMRSSPIVVVDVIKDVRIERLVREYGHADASQFLEAMAKLTKRLGGQHFIAARQKLAQGDMASVIDILLTYYDKAYLQGLEKKQPFIKQRIAWDGSDPGAIVPILTSLQF